MKHKRRKKNVGHSHYYSNRNRHHLLPKARGGQEIASNLLLLNAEWHKLFHKLFGLMTFPEAARLLMRAWNMKKGTEEVL
jgi:hypothetical protein